MSEECSFDDLSVDLVCFDISSKMATVFSWTYGMGYRLIAPLDPKKFDNAASKTKELGIRALIVLGAVFSVMVAGATFIPIFGVVLGAGSKAFRKAGYYFQKNGFTPIRGSAPVKTIANGGVSVMTWNIRGYGGGLHYDYGVVHWRSRIDRIVDSIRKEDSDVVMLQDVQDPDLIKALAQKLGDRYAYFYTHLGPKTFGSESGCMVMTKCAVSKFSYTEFNQHESKINRGFATLEIKASPTDSAPCARIIGTQLTPGAGAAEQRMEQFDQIINQLAKQKLAMPTLFVGSLHVDRDSQTEEAALLSKYLSHSYLDAGPTHSDALVSQWAPIFDELEESSDFISLFKSNPPNERVFPVIEKNVRLLDSHLVEGFENNDTKTARSDHHAVVTTFSGLTGRRRSP